MASVLDAFRGRDRKKHTFLTAAVPDEVYQSWIDELESLPLKQRRKWKTKVDRSDGSTQTIRFEKKGFYAYYLNQRIVCASVSQCNELREANLMSTHVQYEQMFSMDYRSFCDFHDEQMAAAQTGNHQPRNHAVRVPTRAGEPVRG